MYQGSLPRELNVPSPAHFSHFESFPGTGKVVLLTVSDYEIHSQDNESCVVWCEIVFSLLFFPTYCLKPPQCLAAACRYIPFHKYTTTQLHQCTPGVGYHRLNELYKVPMCLLNTMTWFIFDEGSQRCTHTHARMLTITRTQTRIFFFLIRFL